MSNLNPLTNGSYWGPVGEGKDDILLEQTFLFSVVVQALGFGALFVIYVAVMRILWSRRHVSPVTHWALMIHSTLMCIANLLPTLSYAISVEETYINNRNFPGGPAAYLGESAILWFSVIALVGLVAGNVLADWLLLWRCHVIWSIRLKSSLLTDYILLFPALIAIAALGTGIAWNVFNTVPSSFLTSTYENLGVAYLSLSLALNFTLTGMIIFRMKSYQREISECLSPEDGTIYLSIASMFVESAAVYTLVSVPVLVTLAIITPFSEIFMTMAPSVQICCSYFIIWRVADGRAFSGERTQATGPTPTHSFPQFRKSSLVVLTRDSIAALELQPEVSGDVTINKGKDTSIPLAEITRSPAWEEP